MLRLALCANWYGSLGRVVLEQVLFNTYDSRTLRRTGQHAIGRIFGEAAVDDFFVRGVVLVVRLEWARTPVLIDNWNKSVKTDDSSLAAYVRGRLERPSGPEEDFSLRD